MKLSVRYICIALSLFLTPVGNVPIFGHTGSNCVSMENQANCTCGWCPQCNAKSLAMNSSGRDGAIPSLPAAKCYSTCYDFSLVTGIIDSIPLPLSESSTSVLAIGSPSVDIRHSWVAVQEESYLKDFSLLVIASTRLLI